MPKCPSCNVAFPPTDDNFMKCFRCKKQFHWSCTNLDDYLIKLHKKNPYKPWRCHTCVEKYCIKCDKTFPASEEKSICCDKCNFWYHLDCSGLNLDKFQFHCANPSETWICDKCKKNCCKKCNGNCAHKASLSCSVCKFTFHYTCIKIPISLKTDKSFTSTWMCKPCHSHIFPFNEIDNKKVISLSNTKTISNYDRRNFAK